MTSVFAKYQPKAWPYRFSGSLQVRALCGGIPSDPKKAEGFIRSKIAGSDDLIREAVAEIMAERGISPDEAAAVLEERRHLNGFARDVERGGELFIRGGQLKAALKEAASVAVAAGKLNLKGWGRTNKSLVNFLAEHVQVDEDRLYLGVTEPTGINQRFPHTYKGSGIQYEEYVDPAVIHFTVQSDWKFTSEEWAIIWLTGEQQGLGATRSMGYGRYEVTRWDAT